MPELKKRPLFSIIIDNYNYGCYIQQAIDSVLAQHFPSGDMEVIVVDDGSTDDTAQRVAKYKDRVKYIRKKNGGQSSAINTGVEHAGGEVIAFLDSDDFWHREKLRIVAEEFEKSDDIDFMYHYMDVTDDKGKIVDRYIFPEPGRHSEQSYIDNYLKGNLPWFSPTSGMIVRADCLKKIMPLPEEFRIGADIYLHYVLPFYMRDLSLVKKALGYYRLHTNNLSGGNLLTAGKLQRELNLLLRIQEHVEQHSRKLGKDCSFIHKRIEAQESLYGILLSGLLGNRLKATKDALAFKGFLPWDTRRHRVAKRAILTASVLIPSPFLLWLQRKYRKIWHFVDS
ncbi:MAG TPA: glycosyltransferase [Thermodesulfovibrionales bacterium]|nr:glycosyltransferase [Thermodesulfovibrionales bacterium]